MLSFGCDHCRKQFRVKSDLIGKRVKCPACGRATIVTSSNSAGPTPKSEKQPGNLSPSIPSGVDDAPLRGSSVEESDALETMPFVSQPDPTQSPELQGGYDPSLTSFLAPPQADDELGRLGDFRIIKILGHGGMGVVFLGKDPHLNRNVAIKAMLPHLAKSTSSFERFLREARAAAALNHDHIVPIFHVGHDRGAPFIVMPLLSGESLEERIRAGNKLAVEDVYRIGREIAEGLVVAHMTGLIHRDIKPANIWLEAPRDRVKLLDFGLARAEDDAKLTQSGVIVGTPAYMAPEQARGEAVDFRCDLFSLGVILYRLGSGRLPFTAKDSVSMLMAVAMDEPRPIHKVNPDLPLEFSSLVMKLLQKDPKKRVDSANQVVVALQALANDPSKASVAVAKTSAVTQEESTVEHEDRKHSRRPSGPPPLPSPESLSQSSGKQSRNKKPLLLGIAGMLVVLAVTIVMVMIYGPSPTAASSLLRITINEPGIRVAVDQEDFKLTGVGEHKLSLPSGKHGLRIKRGQAEFESDTFLLNAGDTSTLAVEVIEGKLRIAQDGKLIGLREMLAQAVPVKPINKAPAAQKKHYKNALGMEFALVPKGKSWLGGGYRDFADIAVEVDYDFYLGVYEVTQEEWQNVMGNRSSAYTRTGRMKDAVVDISDDELRRFPADLVSWDDATAFAELVNRKANEPGWYYRLPTEIEWEYTCRGGPLADKSESQFFYYFQKPTTEIQPAMANYNKTLNRPCKVGSYVPNRLGLYDMHGNVWEWCADVIGPAPALNNMRRVYRGGDWEREEMYCRVSARRVVNLEYGYDPSYGLRLARVPASKKDLGPKDGDILVRATGKLSNNQVFKFKGSPGNMCMIDVQADFDVNVRVEDSKGKLVSLDDGGIGKKARKFLRPSRPDDYQVIINSNGTSNGMFMVTVLRLGIFN